jgi:serine beta-lactamase-like protein LACTB, mitochondrial
MVMRRLTMPLCVAWMAFAVRGVLGAQVPAAVADVQAYMRAQHMPGLSVAVAVHGQLVWAQGFGFADLENGVPVDTATVFPTASTLKPLTVTAILRLAEDHKLDLDAPVQRYCAAFPKKPHPVTVRALILHEGGIRPSTGAEVFSRTHYVTVSDAVKAFADDSLRYIPGTDRVYSNQGYALLACAIEGASGESYDAYLARAILGPAHMSHTAEENVYRVTPHLSRSYIVRTAANTKAWQGLWTPAQLASTEIDVPAVADPIDPSWEPGAGNFRSTPSDMVRFVLAIERGALLSDSMRAKELTPQPSATDRGASHSYGWPLAEADGQHVPYLLGSNWDGSFGVMTIPADGFVLAVASNIEFNIPDDLFRQLASAFGHHLDIPQ